MNKILFLRITITLFVLLYLYNCGTKPGQDSLPSINLAGNLQNTVNKIPLSNAATSLEIIALETTPECMIKEISQILLTENDIIIYHDYLHPLLRFSKEGNFLNKIGVIGKGPMECYMIGGATLDNHKKEIYLNLGDGINAGFMVYDLDGNFKRKVTLNTYEQIATISPILYYANNIPFFLQNLPVMNPKVKMWNFALLDSLLQPVKTFTNPFYAGREKEITENCALYDGWANYYIEHNPVNIYKDEFKIIYQGIDTIYRYNPASQKFSPSYTLELGERPSFSEARKWIKDYSFFSKLWLSNFYDTQDYIYINIGKDKNNYLAQFNKKDGSVSTIKKEGEITETTFPNGMTYKRRNIEFPGLYNDLCGYPEIFTPSPTNNGKQWIKIVDAFQLLMDTEAKAGEIQATAVKNPGTRNKLFQIASELTEESNPVLFIATLK